MSVNSKMTAIADAIRAKTGKTAPLSLDQMATEIEGISGGTELFAAIGVTYPEGSTVTCTNGSKTLTAKNTSGQWVFAIPEAGTWTVTATDGTYTKNQSVSITSEGQFESLELSYALVLIENGVVAEGFAGETTGLVGMKYLTPAFSVEGYTKLIYEVYIYNLVNPSSYADVGLYTGTSYDKAALVSKYDLNSGITNEANAKTFTIPIPATITSAVYFGSYSIGLNTTIKNARLE